jgi:hypothetical protein
MTLARDSRFIAQLRSRVAGAVREAEPLSRYSTYRIGGPATVFLPRDVDDAATGLATAAESGVPVFPLGLGSNVLLPDDGLEALVVRLGKGIDQLDRADGTWRLGAGLPAPLAARRTADAGWAGLHMMVGVPGTVGGGVYMNAGCHGGQWAEVVTRVTVLDRLGCWGSGNGTRFPSATARAGWGTWWWSRPRSAFSRETRCSSGPRSSGSSIGGRRGPRSTSRVAAASSGIRTGPMGRPHRTCGPQDS